MNDSTMKPEDARGTGVVAALCVAALMVIAWASSINLAGSGTGFDLVTTNSHMTWGAGGYTAAIAALVLPFAVLATPLGERDERPHRD